MCLLLVTCGEMHSLEKEPPIPQAAQVGAPQQHARGTETGVLPQSNQACVMGGTWSRALPSL